MHTFILTIKTVLSWLTFCQIIQMNIGEKANHLTADLMVIYEVLILQT